MNFYLNDLSLHGQFANVATFVESLRTLLQSRGAIERAGHRLYCDQQISIRLAYGTTSFQQTVLSHSDINFKRIISSWIDKSGPFWPEERTHSTDEYFACNDDVVTDTTLGEVAFRIASDDDAKTLSFSPSNFAYTPIVVTWERPSHSQTIEIDNFWQHPSLESYLVGLKTPPTSWAELITRSKAEFVNLVFLDSFGKALNGEPFNSSIANRALVLLQVLSDLQHEVLADGSYTPKGSLIWDNYFNRGESSIFSNSSPTERITFKEALTFQLPDGTGHECFFHGKIRHLFFRLHHSWPPKLDEPLYIAYLGPKITKT